jgi:hypothetical protein
MVLHLNVCTSQWLRRHLRSDHDGGTIC